MQPQVPGFSTGAGAASTAVDATLKASTAAVGFVGQGTAASSTAPWTVSVVNPTTAVTVSNPTSAVDANLTSAGSTRTIGVVGLNAGSSANTLGSVALVAGSSANIIGQVVQGPGSSANPWFQQSRPFSSGSVSITTVNSSVDASVIAANASRNALVIASLSTVQVVAIGLTTATMTTGLANAHMYLQPMAQLTFGLPGGMPNYQGPIRAINVTSTLFGGGLSVVSF